MAQNRSGASDARPPAWDRDAVADEEYEEVARSLVSADSPVGIDAKHTHVLILHALERIERRLRIGAGAGEAPNAVPLDREPREEEVRRQVRQILSRAAAYDSLGPKGRERLAAGLTQLMLLALGAEGRPADFPQFVADMIAGTFQAIVDVSKRQMEAYAELVEGAADAADQFTRDCHSEASARQRQQLLATMVLMGITRIEVRHGRVRTRTIFGDESAEADE